MNYISRKYAKNKVNKCGSSDCFSFLSEVENRVFSGWEGRGMRCGKFEKKKGKILNNQVWEQEINGLGKIVHLPGSSKARLRFVILNSI